MKGKSNQLLIVLLIVASIPLIGLGIGAMFVPNSMLEVFDLSPKGTYGLNTIRSDLGGLLIGSAVMIWIGLWTHQKTWFAAPALLMALLLLGRFISVVIDGWTPATIPAVVVEILVILVLSIKLKGP